MVLNDLVNLIFGSLPPEFEFIKIFGYIFVLYIFWSIFKLFIDIIKDLMRF